MNLRFVCGVFALTVAFTPAAATTIVAPHMVKDILTDRGYGGSAPRDFVGAGNRFYFSAQTPLNGRELYVSDGTNAQLLADLVPGTGSSNVVPFGVSNGRIIVDADDAVAGEQISAVDAQTGTSVALINFGAPLRPGEPRASRIGQVGARTLFEIRGNGRELWSTDGTPGGTVQLPQGFYWGGPENFCNLGDRVLYIGSDGRSIWRTDGSAVGTTLVASLTQESQINSSARGGSACYFLFNRNSGWSLWRSDGTGATVAGLQSSGYPIALAATPTAAIVADRSTASRLRLWSTASAQPIADIADSATSALHTVGTRVVLVTGVTENSQSVSALFVSDGTAAGTRRLTVPADYSARADDGCSRVLGSVLVLSCERLWRIDPASGAVTSAATGYQSFDLIHAAVFGSALVGAGRPADQSDADEVWRTDGTATGTRELHDIWQKNRSSVGGVFPVAVNGTRIFFAGVQNDAAAGTLAARAFWRSDGTEAGTLEFPNALYGGGRIDALAAFGDGVLFMSQLNSSAAHYRSNGMPNDVRRVVDDTYFNLIQSSENRQSALLSCKVGTSSWDLCGMRSDDAQAAIVLPRGQDYGRVEVVGALDDKVVFYISDYSATPDRRGLWRSDGTAPGTFRIVPDLQPANHYGQPRPASLADGNRLWFDGTVYGNGGQRGLYVSDLTLAGTRLVAELPAVVTAFAKLGGGRIAFVAGEYNSQLWVSDGTPAGTQVLRTFTGTRIDRLEPVGGRVHFFAPNGSVLGYYVSDGTKHGTFAADLPSDLRIEGAQFPKAIDDGTAVLTCKAADTGLELCAIDADGSNLRLVQDIFPGPETSFIEFMARTSDALYFTADDGYHGSELWRIPFDRLFANGFE